MLGHAQESRRLVATALLASVLCGNPSAFGQVLQPLLPEEFRAALSAAERAAGESRSAAPVLQLFDRYKGPAEVAELEMLLGMLYGQRTGLVDQTQAVLHLGKALQYDLPERKRLQALMWRWGGYWQLKDYDAARKDLLRILLICSYHDLPDSNEDILEPKPAAPSPIGEPRNPERALDYDYYRKQNDDEDFLLLSRFTAVDGIRNLQKQTGLRDEQIHRTLEELSPSPLRQEVVKRWLAAEIKGPVTTSRPLQSGAVTVPPPATSLVAGAQEAELQIVGRVVDATSGAPIAGVMVMLDDGRPSSGPDRSIRATTDGTGAFGFRHVADGDYRMRAYKDGYFEVTEGINWPPVKVTADMRLRGVEFRMRRTARISGVVVDGAGRPVRIGAKVTAIRVVKQADGSARYLPGPGTEGTTDAEGRFTISSLRPDRYLICVNCATRMNPTLDGILDFGDQGLTWYGDTADVATASAVTVVEGEQRTGLRIVAAPMRLHDVIVRPVGPPPAAVPWIGVMVAEAPDSYEIHFANAFAHAEREADGSYRIRNLTPGHYSLVGYAKLHAVDVGAGEAQFDVTDADTEVTVHMTLGGFGSVHGAVKWDGDPQPAAQDQLVLTWAGAFRGSWPRMASAIGTDGTFHITEQVIPGAYLFRLETKTPGTVLRGVRCNGVEVTATAPLRVGDRQQVTGCEVTLGKSAPAR